MSFPLEGVKVLDLTRAHEELHVLCFARRGEGRFQALIVHLLQNRADVELRGRR